METQRDIDTRALDEMATVNGGIQVYSKFLKILSQKHFFPGRFLICRFLVNDSYPILF